MQCWRPLQGVTWPSCNVYTLEERLWLFTILAAAEHKTWCLPERTDLNLSSTSLKPNFLSDSIINISMVHDLGLHSVMTKDNQSQLISLAALLSS